MGASLSKIIMGALANVFSLLADQQGKEASSIVALKTAELRKIPQKKKMISDEKKKGEPKKKKKISEEKKETEAKKKRSSAGDGDGGGRGKEGRGHATETFDGNDVHQRYNNGPSNGSDNCNVRADTPVYISCLKTKGKTGDRQQANKEHKAVDHHGNQNQGKVSVRSAVLSKEELRERWLAREKEKKEEEAQRREQWLVREAERKERWLAREAEFAREAERKARRLAREAEREKRRLAREEERKKEIEERRKKEMAMKTLQEYEEQKAFEKQKAEKVTLTVRETPLREATQDNIYTKQKSNDESNKKDSDIKKNRKVQKKVNIEEFLKLPTGREGQDGQGGGNQKSALPDEDDTVKRKAGSALDLSETSFPVLGKVIKPA